MSNVVPHIVEIVGPAGAGKTTLCHELSHSNESIHHKNFPDVRSMADAPFFIWNGLQIISTLLGLPKHGSRRITRREFAWLSILWGWPRVLQNELKENHGIILLDQGPVYLLAEASEFGPRYLKEQQAHLFWKRLYSRWADVVDIIVWLDAADGDLLTRIRGRDKEHIVKNESVGTTLEFLACYRRAYERTISGLLSHRPGLRIFRFDTSRISSKEIAGQLSVQLFSAT